MRGHKSIGVGKCCVGCFLLLVLLLGCSQAEKDKGIKQMIGTAAKEDVAFAGVSYTVEQGVVTLTGSCPSEKQKGEVEKAVKQLAGVKKVVNEVVVAPVVLTADHPLQQSVDSVLMKYPSISARVKDSVIYVRGKADQKEAGKLMPVLQKLGAKAVQNELITTAVK